MTVSCHLLKMYSMPCTFLSFTFLTKLIYNMLNEEGISVIITIYKWKLGH